MVTTFNARYYKKTKILLTKNISFTLNFFYCQYTAILFTFLRTTKYSCLKKCCKILECVYHLQKKII